MARIVSIDFGTTNCAVSYCDNNKDIEMAKAYQGREIIPSIVAYDNVDGEISIGRKDLKGTGSFKVFEAFKMLLGEDIDTALLNKYGYDSTYTPQKVAKDFINELMKHLTKCIGDIGELYVTIPHIWEKNTNLQSKEVLRKLFEDCGYTVKKFIPEPVAAASYFCHKYQLNSKSQFKGHLLVVDWGGGTLDISLCEANEKEIKVLETTGCGDIGNNDIGQGGFAYDRITCINLLKKNDIVFNIDEIDKDKNFHELLLKFENSKISSTDNIKKQLFSYFRDKCESDIPLNKYFNLSYSGNSINVNTSDLLESFVGFEKALTEELNKIYKYINDNRIDTSGVKPFKIIPSGGFSAYYLVERAISEYFKSSQASDDTRFPTPKEISLNDRGLAISKGASVLGAGLIELVPMVMWTVGVKFYEFLDNGITERAFKIFEKGKKYAEYKQKKYLIDSEILYPISAHNAAFKLYVESNGEQEDMPIFKNSEFFPDNQVDIIKYKLAYQIIDDSFVIIIEYTNIKEKERKIPLNKLTELFNGGSFIPKQKK